MAAADGICIILMPGGIPITARHLPRLPVMKGMFDDGMCDDGMLAIDVPDDKSCSAVGKFLRFGPDDYVLDSDPAVAAIERHTLDWLGVDVSALMTARELHEKLREVKMDLQKRREEDCVEFQLLVLYEQDDDPDHVDWWCDSFYVALDIDFSQGPGREYGRSDLKTMDDLVTQFKDVNNDVSAITSYLRSMCYCRPGLSPRPRLRATTRKLGVARSDCAESDLTSGGGIPGGFHVCQRVRRVIAG
jgi:hypothetical protein